MNYTSNIIEHIPFLKYMASKASRILELGVETGNGSTRAFDEGFGTNDEGLVWIGVDRNIPPNMPADKRFKFIQGDTTSPDTLWKVSYELSEYSPVADMIFIDTHHTEEQINKELRLWCRLANNMATTWIFHDTWMNGSYNTMTDVIKQFAVLNGYRYMDYSKTCNGLGVMTK
jgi:cephalosporin hydroxylase